MAVQDISRIGFDPRKRYSGVHMQQGRVITDDDWNEHARITSEDHREGRLDIIGAAGSPDDGFRIHSPEIASGLIDFQIAQGSFYIGGHRTLTGAERFREQTDWLLQEAGIHTTPQTERYDLVYLFAWEQPVTATEDSELLEVALGGPDTSTRKRLLHHVKIFENVGTNVCGLAWNALKDSWTSAAYGTVNSDYEIATDATLTVEFSEDSKQDDLCAPNIAGGYLGAENQAVRVQLVNESHFTWGFDNASPLYRVSATPNSPDVAMITQPKDQMHWPLSGQVVEILPRMAILPNGERLAGIQGHLTKVDQAFDPVTGELTLTDVLPAGFGEEWDTSGEQYYFMRVWNRGTDTASDAAIPFTPGATVALGQTGLLVTIDGSELVGGDYWVIAARPESPNEVVPWQLTDGMSPHGVRRYAAPLALIQWAPDANNQMQGQVIQDCRKKFRPLTEQDTCCTYSVGDGVQSFGDFNNLTDAVNNLPPKGGQICLLPGLHSANLHLLEKNEITIKGCGKRSKLIPSQGQRSEPIIRVTDCKNVEISGIDFITHDGAALALEGTEWGSLDSVNVENCRFLALTSAIRVRRGRNIHILKNNVRILDRSEGEACLSIMAENVNIEKNDIAVIPADIKPPYDDAPPDVPAADGEPQPNPVDPCADTEIVYANYGYIIYYADFIWGYYLVDIPENPYRAYGGIHLLGSCENVHLWRNRITGGSGNGITLGGLPFGGGSQPEPQEGVRITHNEDVFYAAVGNAEGNYLTGVDVYLQNQQNTFHAVSDANGGVSIQAPAGQYDLYLQPGYAIDKVEQRNIGDRITYHLIFAREVEIEVTEEQGFLYEVQINNNEIQMMGRSGIGFALLENRIPFQPDPGTDNQLIRIFLEALISRFAAGLNQIRELTIRENHIHHNFRNPLTEALREELTEIGLGGISLGLCEDVFITNNHIAENGTAGVPACGVFGAYVENAEIVGNSVDNNGPVSGNEEGERPEGISGGIYLKFASSLTAASDSATNHRLAVRLQDNRIDQPAGRAVTVLAFGSISCVNNHCNSENSGSNGLLDLMVGSVLIINLGGVQNFIAIAGSDTQHNVTGELPAMDVSAATSGFGRAQAAAAELPAGTVLFNSNQVRQGIPNRSIFSNMIVSLDDVGMDGNQLSVHNRDYILINSIVVGASSRLSDNRYREFSETAFISLYANAFRMNTVSMNQADHCIIAEVGDNALPLVNQGNLTFNNKLCDSIRENPASFILQQALGRILADQYGNQVPTKDNSREFVGVASQQSIQSIQSLQTVKRTQQIYEKQRLQQKFGSDNYRVIEYDNRLEKNANIINHLEVESELARITPKGIQEKGSVIDGRIGMENNAGAKNMTVELVDKQGNPVGYEAKTDASGYYSLDMQESDLQKLGGEENVYLRVKNLSGEEVYTSDEPLTLTENQRITKELQFDNHKIFGGGGIRF